MKINFKNGKANKIHIYVDGQYSMTADRDFVAGLSCHNNMEISESELEQLKYAVNIRRAFNKAVDLLSRRDHSSGEILAKLRQKGFEEGAEEAIEKLEQYGYIDDRRFAQNYASQLRELKGFGNRRIAQELYKKSIDREIISEVLDSFEFDEEKLADIIERKFSKSLDNEKGIRRTINSLVRMGYNFSEIKTALEEFQSRSENRNDE